MNQRRLVYDLRCLQDQKRFHGIGRYARGVIQDLRDRLQEVPFQVEYCFYDSFGRLKTRPFSAHENPDDMLPRSWTIEHLFLSPKFRRRYSQLPFRKLCRDDTTVHFLDQTNCPYRFPGKAVITVHDIIPTKVGPWSRSDSELNIERGYYSGIVQWATHIVTDSESSRNDIMKDLGVARHKVTMVPPPFHFEIISQPGPRDSSCQFLFVGGFERRKNVDLALQAFDRFAADPLGRKYRLVIVGESSEEDKQRVRPLLAELTAGAQVQFREFVSDSELRKLMDESRALLFVSHYEGFGYPALEAMSHGLPVICARNSSIPEVVGPAGTYIDSTDVEGLVDAMKRIARTSSAELASLVHQGLEQAHKIKARARLEVLLQIYSGIR